MNMECTYTSRENYAFPIRMKKSCAAYSSGMKHRLVEIRNQFGLSQTEMGEIMGLGLRGYQYIEHGERDLAPRHIRMAAKHLNIPEGDFYENAGDVITRKLSLIDEDKRAELTALYEKQQAAFSDFLDGFIIKEEEP